MSSLKDAKRRKILYPRTQVRALAEAADQAALAEDRGACIDYITAIFELLDSAFKTHTLPDVSTLTLERLGILSDLGRMSLTLTAMSDRSD